MNAKTILFAALAVGGLVGTQVFNVRHVLAGRGLLDFVVDGFATDASSSLTLDLVAGTLAWIVFMVAEARRLGMRWWLYLVLTFVVAFGVACPLFFALRERRLAQLAAEGEDAGASRRAATA